MITKRKTPDREAWKELRSHFIGGSDAAAVVGLNPFSSPYSLWAEKTGKTPSFEGNLATEVGTYLEEFVAKKFEETTGKKVRRCNQSILNDEYPWAIANIDREVVGEDAGLEIKTTSELNTRKFKGGDYPANYYVQCVHYLAVTGKKKWYLAVLIGNRDFRVFEIERDEDEIAALMKSEEAFWEHVKTDTPPEADGMKSTTETIQRLYPEDDGGEVDLFGYEDSLRQYMELSEQIKQLEEYKAQAANRVKAFLGEAQRGSGMKYKVSWTSSQRRSFDVKRFAKDYADIDLSSYYNTTTARTFRVTEIK